jgi:hypothetical protein
MEELISPEGNLLKSLGRWSMHTFLDPLKYTLQRLVPLPANHLLKLIHARSVLSKRGKIFHQSLQHYYLVGCSAYLKPYFLFSRQNLS